MFSPCNAAPFSFCKMCFVFFSFLIIQDHKLAAPAFAIAVVVQEVGSQGTAQHHHHHHGLGNTIYC